MPFHIVARLGAIALGASLFGAPPTQAEAASRSVDLRADTNRSGRVSLSQSSDDRGEARWTARRGAIVLANVDDDGRRCGAPVDGSLLDQGLAACNDGADEVVNGKRDQLDLAPLRTAPSPVAPTRMRTTVEVVRGSEQARLFVRRDGAWQHRGDRVDLRVGEVREGARLAVEARDVVRDRALWDGRIGVRLTARRGGLAAHDSVELKVAPIIVTPETLEAEKVLTSPSAESDRVTWVERSRSAVAGAPLEAPARVDWETGMEQLAGPSIWNFEGLAAEQQASQARFTRELRGALGRVDLRPRVLRTGGDIWTQDIFESGFSSMPGPGGPQVMRVLVRSANAMRNGSLLAQRGGGRAVFTQLRGPDVGAVQQTTPGLPTLPFVGLGDDTLNSTGNFTATPPHRSPAGRFPFGRLVFGSVPGSRPDPAFVKLLTDQRVQQPILLDTSWLEVGHIDEFLAFLPADTERGWVAVVADPDRGYELLQRAATAGDDGPEPAILTGLDRVVTSGLTPSRGPAARLVSEVLADPQLEAANARAGEAIAANLELLRNELGLAPEDIVRVPVLYEQLSLGLRGGVGALLPNGINSLYVRDGLLVAPRQHGPTLGGVDIFERAFEQGLGRIGIDVRWAETYYHASGAGAGGGEVHCTTNVLRDPSGLTAWWRRSR